VISSHKRDTNPRQWVILRKVFVGGKQAVNTRSAESNSGGVLRQGFTRGFSLPRENGQDLIEFAIVLPLLLLIIFGAVDLGRLFHATVAITNAAREGARFGGLYRNKILNFDTNTCIEPLENMLKVVDDKDFNEIIFISCSEGRASGIDISRMTVTPSCPDPDGCIAFKPVFLTVTYDFEFILGNFVPGIGGMPGPDMTLQRTAEMLIQ
jgi:hypothetical protein